jgi:hypothetical protein
MSYRPVPLLGEHSQYVLHELLGIPTSDMSDLASKGVIIWFPLPLSLSSEYVILIVQ